MSVLFVGQNVCHYIIFRKNTAIIISCEKWRGSYLLYLNTSYTHAKRQTHHQRNRSDSGSSSFPLSLRALNISGMCPR